MATLLHATAVLATTMTDDDLTNELYDRNAALHTLPSAFAHRTAASAWRPFNAREFCVLAVRFNVRSAMQYESCRRARDLA